MRILLLGHMAWPLHPRRIPNRRQLQARPLPMRLRPKGFHDPARGLQRTHRRRKPRRPIRQTRPPSARPRPRRAHSLATLPPLRPKHPRLVDRIHRPPPRPVAIPLQTPSAPVSLRDAEGGNIAPWTTPPRFLRGLFRHPNHWRMWLILSMRWLTLTIPHRVATS